MTGLLAAVLAAILFCLGNASGAAAQAADARSRLLAYHETWSEARTRDPARTRLANIPPYVGTVILAFAKPDLTYHAFPDLSGTGLTPPFDGRVLREAIALRRAAAPGSRVLLGLGGATYVGWDRLDHVAVARLVRDLDLDGVEIDYEPPDAGCRRTEAAGMRCPTDARFANIVTVLRGALPRPLLLGIDIMANGAFGEGRWRDAVPVTGYTGSALSVLRSPAAGAIDMVLLMAYNAGTGYDATAAFDATRAAWAGPLFMGLLVPPDETGGSLTLAEAERRARHAAADPKGGLYLYTLQIVPKGTPGPANPDAAMLSAMTCRVLGAARCNAPLP